MSVLSAEIQKQVEDRLVKEGLLPAADVKKFKDEAVLLRQPYIRDDKVTIGKLLLEQVASIGENIVVRRFVRWELGEIS